MWKPHPQSFAFSAPAMAARHVRRSPGFIDEDLPFRVEVELAIEPVQAPFLRTSGRSCSLAIVLGPMAVNGSPWPVFSA
jgi:hypothetical protein